MKCSLMFPNGAWERDERSEVPHHLVPNVPLGTQHYEALLHRDEIRKARCNCDVPKRSLGTRSKPRYLVPNVPLGTQHYEALLHRDEIRKARCRVRRSQTELGNEK